MKELGNSIKIKNIENINIKNSSNIGAFLCNVNKIMIVVKMKKFTII